jgi:hypothetical protein
MSTTRRLVMEASGDEYYSQSVKAAKHINISVLLTTGGQTLF